MLPEWTFVAFDGLMPGMDESERNFAAQDKEWTGPKFIGLGIVTLIIAVGIIVFAAARTGCSLVVVP